jgi:hypothetical protein
VSTLSRLRRIRVLTFILSLSRSRYYEWSPVAATSTTRARRFHRRWPVRATAPLSHRVRHLQGCSRVPHRRRAACRRRRRTCRRDVFKREKGLWRSGCSLLSEVREVLWGARGFGLIPHLGRC